MNKLTQREKTLAFVAAVVILLAVAIALWPTGSNGSGLAELEQMSAAIERDAALLEKYERLAGRFGNPDTPLESGEAGNRLTQLIYSAAKGNANLTQVSQMGSQKIRGFSLYAKVVVRADFTVGDLDKLMKFLTKLENSADVLAIEELIVKSPKKKPTSGTITVSAFAKPQKKKKGKG